MTHQSPSFFGAGMAKQPFVTDGLYCHLDAGNAASYPGSGTAWSDLSGRGHNWTLSGPTWDAEGFFSFDGVNDRVTQPGYSLFQTLQRQDVPATLEFVLFMEAAGSGGATPGNCSILGNTKSPGNYAIQLESIGSAGTVTKRPLRQGGYTGSGAFPETGFGRQLPTGRFTHILLSFQPNGSEGFWLGDGVFEVENWHNSTGWTSGSATYNLNMGVANPDGAGAGWLYGKVAMFRAYERKLTQNEAIQNWKNARPTVEALNG